MEALHSQLTTGEQSGGQERCQLESPEQGPQPKSPPQPSEQQQTSSPKTHGTQQPPKPSRRQNPERKRLRHQRQSTDSDTVPEHKQEATKAAKETTVSSLSPGALPPSTGGSTQSKTGTHEGTPRQKRERKPQRPGKYVCTYCGRACAKPSVLQKHIRSHTGERPYPCAPCGFSFKTKSNLYKHRKSHTHRVKAGLAFGEPKSVEEQVTESEDETRQLSSASSLAERQGSLTSVKSHEKDLAKDVTGENSDSYAVKKRLALRLSKGKHTPQDSSDEKSSSLVLDSRGSTESGYFSRSESTEQSQDSPPNTSAKSYAEIILGKYGRLGHLQKLSRHQNQHQDDKNISFTVPKKQVIDHITKLITINEAVVDTSKLDSVKPRRFSLSRKNSSESQKTSNVKELSIHSPTAGDMGYKSSGSITMGVPCEKFHHPPLNVEQPASQTSTAPLVRSHSMPSAASPFSASSENLNKFRLSQSFDERPTSRRYGMLRRQPAIEIPIGTELSKEEQESAHSFYPDSVTTVTEPRQPQPYECEACGTGCQDWEGYKKHKLSLCRVHHPRNQVVVSQLECSQLVNHTIRAGASTMRKRRKEESFESDDPSSPPLTSSSLVPGQGNDESSVTYEGPRRPALQTCSVIQHTSSFEKQESLCSENQTVEASKNSPPRDDYQLVHQKQPSQRSTKLAAGKLVRQHNVQVPEILVTEDPDMSAETSIESTSTGKPSDKPEEFQWPQRSPSLAQLPIEKLPPKKKRLRLAEVAQSSGESSFDSLSLPRSPSQDSSASYASSRSTSFEEASRTDMEIATSTPLRRSRAPHMLTVPGVHQHREMRRSASEQAPHDPQQSILMAETRSKSFDYSCLSPERSVVGWRERRKCLLMRHSAIRDPDEEEEEQYTNPNQSSEQASPSRPSPARSPVSLHCSRSSSSPLSTDTALHDSEGSQSKEVFSQWKLTQNIQLMGTTEMSLSRDQATGVKKEVVHVLAEQPPAQNTQSYPSHGPLGAARAHYLPMSTGLKLEIPLRHEDYPQVRISQSHIQESVPHITSSLEMLRPVTSPTVAVRLQTDTLSPACAIYTTLSQSTSPRPPEAVDTVSTSVGILAAEYRHQGPHLQAWPNDCPRSQGSGGNKRMLSPSNSIELTPESQQQQKRVKEEEEREVADKDTADTCSQDFKREPCLQDVSSANSHVGPSFPSLLSGTCNSWCYLNYIKPNPATLDEQKPSVYSSWSTSGYDPNPPGLSSKTALSLLHCKQRLSPSIYTISPMSARTAESVEQEDGKRPCSTKVYSSQPYCSDYEGTEKRHTSTRKEETEEEEKKQEKNLDSRNKQPPGLSIFEMGSNKNYGDGVEKCQCEDSLPNSCKHCDLVFKATGVCEAQSLHPDKEKNSQCSELQKGGGREEDITKDKGGGHDEDSGSRVAVSTHSDSEKAHTIASAPKEMTQRGSASARRALFARRRLNAEASVSSRSPHSPTSQPVAPQRDHSPPHSPSPRLQQSLSPHLSLSPSCHASTAPQRPVSPVRGLSPVIVQSQVSDSSGPPGSLAGSFTQCQNRLHAREQPSGARLSVDEVGPTHITSSSLRPRVAHNLLSHLPLHSQQPNRSSNLLIPIGGIHMIQPRSALPLYSLVSSPAASSPQRLADAPKGRLTTLRQHQETLRETLSCSRASSPHPEAPGQTPAGALLHRESQGCLGIQQLLSPKTETRQPEEAGLRSDLFYHLQEK
ncbi:transcription factor HIVEP3 [Pholidichthys leucotaenia]